MDTKHDFRAEMRDNWNGDGPRIAWQSQREAGEMADKILDANGANTATLLASIDMLIGSWIAHHIQETKVNNPDNLGPLGISAIKATAEATYRTHITGRLLGPLFLQTGFLGGGRSMGEMMGTLLIEVGGAIDKAVARLAQGIMHGSPYIAGCADLPFGNIRRGQAPEVVREISRETVGALMWCALEILALNGVHRRIDLGAAAADICGSRKRGEKPTAQATYERLRDAALEQAEKRKDGDS